jgi:hypothetical protein
MSQSANLPAPFLGIKQSVPIAALSSPNCETLLNFNVTQQGISLRKGDSKYKNIVLPSPDGLFNYGDTKLFMTYYEVSSDKTLVYDVDAGANDYIPFLVAGRENFYGNVFNKYLYLFSPVSYKPGFVYNGVADTWALIGYTGATTFSPIGGCNYRNRQYIIQYQEAAYWYSEIDAITGTCTKVDLSSVVQNVCALSTIATITISNTGASVDLIAFVFSNGEVLFYSGSYPDADNWTRVAAATIAQPIDYNSFIKYGSDTLILTDVGLISLKQLFLEGAEAATNATINTDISQTWSKIIMLVRAARSVPNGPITPSSSVKAWAFRGVWDSATNRIIIMFPCYLDSAGALAYGIFYFVYSTIYKAWSFHLSANGSATYPAKDIVMYQNTVLVMADSATEIMIWSKEGATGFTDRNVNDDADLPYTYEMLSAPIPFPKTAAYEATQIEPILESDLYAQTNWNLVCDFGRQTSGDQKTDAATTAVAKPAVNVGMQNITYVQAKMSGTTTTSKTVGLDLYSYNVWYNAGNEGSR